MTSPWYHESSIEWLKARTNFLTASNVATLWPETATGRKRIVTTDDYIAAILNAREFAPENAISQGAAARGHILEPYALKEFTLQTGIKAEHWDDALIHDNGYIAVSPDSLNIPQPKEGILFDVRDLPCIKEVNEIKCYGASKHYQTYREGICAIERIQIATQMYVCKDANIGRLILYNPRLEYGGLLITRWARESLDHELEIIHDIEEKYIKSETILNNGVFFHLKGLNEQEIIAEQRAFNL